jgi:hypothetical protein
MRRYQVGYTEDKFSKLYGRASFGLRRTLCKALPQQALKWRITGDPWNETKNRRVAARQMVRDAKDRKGRTDYQVQGAATTFHLRVGTPVMPTNIPAAALKTAATKRILAFHEEMQLVFPDWKTIGLYVPRTLKTPGSTYWSEHAWADADDTGMKDDKNPGAWETDITRLKPFLDQVNAYILANFTRLELQRSIYNRTSYVRKLAGYLPGDYTGSDAHTTHIHTQTADHDGKKPPWV